MRFSHCRLSTMVLSVAMIGFWAPRALAQSAIQEFHAVSPGLFRGARPDDAGLRELAQLGIKTIVNLEDDEAAVAQETELATSLGMTEVVRPMSGFWKPSRRQVAGTLAILKDPARYPIFVHCQHGQDRTGLIVGLHRVQAEGWSPEVAYQEMLSDGFHRALFLLQKFFEDATGFDD